MKFLDRITITSKLHRSTLFKRNADNHTYYDRVWESKPLEEKTDVTFLGYRTLANGTVEHEAYDPLLGEGDLRYLGHATYVKVALVIKNERTNPFYVSLEDCQSA